PKFLEFRAMVVTLSMAAFATYALFPAVPPWMASDQGEIGDITRLIGNVWQHLGVGAAASIWGHGGDWSNTVAAVPSLHVGFPTLICCFFWPTGKWWVRALCLTYVAAMSFALVGMRAPGVRILDPGCVAKTYPGFWDDLARVSGTASL
ncbi:MAG TPA: phosphatase PAP2 family protein, partial [Microthrixaceae bacterium]|nr:phosphatase PAP2 family protein [Microthrixaceae bacterium]